MANKLSMSQTNYPTRARRGARETMNERELFIARRNELQGRTRSENDVAATQRGFVSDRSMRRRRGQRGKPNVVTAAIVRKTPATGHILPPLNPTRSSKPEIRKWAKHYLKRRDRIAQRINEDAA